MAKRKAKKAARGMARVPEGFGARFAHLAGVLDVTEAELQRIVIDMAVRGGHLKLEERRRSTARGRVGMLGARVAVGFGQRFARLAKTLEVTKGELLEMVVEHYELVRQAGHRDWRAALQRRRTEFFGVRVRAEFKTRCLRHAREFSGRRAGGRHVGFGDIIEVMVDAYEAFRAGAERLPAEAKARLCTTILGRY